MSDQQKYNSTTDSAHRYSKEANKARQIDGHKLSSFTSPSLQPRPRLRF